MEWTQIVLVVSISLITGTLVWVGYSIISLLRDLKVTVFRTNQILADTQAVTAAVRGPVASFSEFVLGFKNGMAVFNSFFPKNSKSKLTVEK